MKIDFNKYFVSLSGKEDENAHMGETLGQLMAFSSSKNFMKMFSIGSKLFNKEEVEVDKSDYDEIKNFIEQNEKLNNLMKYQLIEQLGEFKK